MKKLVHYFGGSSTDGNANMKDLLGGKGANLAEMCSIGLPVPHGFTITTEVCSYYFDNNRTLPSKLKNEIDQNNRSRSAKLRYAIRSKNKFSYPHELIEKFKNYLNLEAINV